VFSVTELPVTPNTLAASVPQACPRDPGRGYAGFIGCSRRSVTIRSRGRAGKRHPSASTIVTVLPGRASSPGAATGWFGLGFVEARSSQGLKLGDARIRYPVTGKAIVERGVVSVSGV
jgi:hypothetical protein